MKRILVVSHDGGGAELVSAWARAQSHDQLEFLVEGPAATIFPRKMPGLSVLSREQAFLRLPSFDLVVTGTSWASDLEKRAIALCKSSGVPVASYLDHWGNYRARFADGKSEVLPNEIWVGDRHAEKVAAAVFPELPIKLEPNRYFEEVIDACRAQSRFLHQQSGKPGERTGHTGQPEHVLYLCEPISLAAAKSYGNPRHYGYTEFEALELFLHYLVERGAGNDPNVKAPPGSVRLRLHPAEKPGRYDAMIETFSGLLPIVESSGRLLAEDLAWSDWVAGCDSSALAVAVLCGKKVYSCIPAAGPPLSLPFPEIIELFRGP